MSDVAITIPEYLVQPLVGLIDAGLRATGLKAAAPAAALAEAIERGLQAARQAALEPAPAASEPERRPAPVERAV